MECNRIEWTRKEKEMVYILEKIERSERAESRNKKTVDNKMRINDIKRRYGVKN